MQLQFCNYLGHAPHSFRRSDQPGDLILKHGSAQGHPTLGRTHLDRSRVGDGAPDRGAHPLTQDSVVHRLLT